jgi:hypothetical protein
VSTWDDLDEIALDSIPIDAGTEGIGGLDQVRLTPELGQPTWVELIVVVGDPPHLSVHRDIVDPSMYQTVGDLTRAMGYGTVAYAPYSRDWFTGTLSMLDWTDQLSTGAIVVLLSGEIYGGFSRLAQVLNSRPQLMPKRMVWPV